MRNEKFIKGELTTHFIEDEGETLMREMKNILATEVPLADKFAELSSDGAKIAAIAGVAAYLEQQNKK